MYSNSIIVRKNHRRNRPSVPVALLHSQSLQKLHIGLVSLQHPLETFADEFVAKVAVYNTENYVLTNFKGRMGVHQLIESTHVRDQLNHLFLGVIHLVLAEIEV